MIELLTGLIIGFSVALIFSYGYFAEDKLQTTSLNQNKYRILVNPRKDMEAEAVEYVRDIIENKGLHRSSNERIYITQITMNDNGWTVVYELGDTDS